jgi:hypothetical protein
MVPVIILEILESLIDNHARISHLEEQISSVVTDIAVIKSQHRENHET